MRHFPAALLVLFTSSLALAEAPSFKEARQRWLRGNYQEARTIYVELNKDSKSNVPCAIGISQCWESVGEYDKALEAIAKVLEKEQKNAVLHARHADLLYQRGQWKEAEAAYGKALEIDKDNFLARWVKTQVLRDRGDQKQADTESRWFVRAFNDRREAKNDITDPDELLVIGLASAEKARWHNQSDEFETILSIYDEALKSEKDYWLAEYQAGLILLEKYNRADATKAFSKAIKINPNAAPVLAASGQLALQRYDIKQAEQYADRALAINPKLPDALRLRADIRMLGLETQAALDELEKARKVNPRDEKTLGRIAGCYWITKKKDKFEALVKEVGEFDSKPGGFYFSLAESLDERKLYDDAEGYYKKAIELRPMVPWAVNNLAMLQMRMGREKEAFVLLKKAFEADAFNVRIANMLKVLRHLEKYETMKTDHFEIRFDPTKDRVLANYVAQELEVIWADLAKRFDYKPKGLILVEIFNNHDMFSGRVIALPDLHTIGACTGRMFAMVSPNGKGVKPFNWARVIRHELVHIFNLEQTNFQVPHWLTEGLAVMNEGFPRPPSWNQELAERVAHGNLMNLDNITMGFVRPKSDQDWQMAYCQSQLYVEYLAKQNDKAVAGMLDAYRDGLTTDEGLKKVCKVDKAAFEKGYRKYLEDVVKGIKGKKKLDKPMTLEQLRAANKKEPGNVDIAARLAEKLLDRKQNTEARKLVDGVLKEKPKHTLASFLKAKLKLQAGDVDEARELLEAAIDPKEPEARVIEQLAELYYEAKELEKAEKLFETARKVEPLEPKWMVGLGRVYAQMENKDKQIEILKLLVPTNPDDIESRKRLALMLLDAERYPEAEQFAKQAMEIDVTDTKAQDMLLKALTAQKKDAETAKLKKLLAGK